MSKRLAVYLGILLSFYLILILKVVERPFPFDFAIFYSSAELYFEGRSLYTPVSVERFVPWQPEWGPRPEKVLPNLNPPFLTLLLMPLTAFRFPTAFWIWSVLSLLAGMAAISVVERTTGDGPVTARRLGFLILLLAYFPTWANVEYGQLGLFLLLLISSSWAAARAGRESWAGVFLGLAMSCKLFVALLFLFFLLRKRWRLLLWMGATFAACWLGALCLFGMQSFHDYASALSTITWSSASWNASFLGFFTRLLGGSENVPMIQSPQLARLLSSLFSVCSALALVWVAHSPATGGSLDQFDLGYSLTLVLMILISPLGWVYYFPLLLLPIVVIWLRARTLAKGKWYGVLLVVAVVLSSVPTRLIPASDVNTPADWLVWSGVYFYALLLLSGLLIGLSRRLRCSTH